MSAFDWSQWSPEAQTRWQRWWEERLRDRRPNNRTFVAVTAFEGDSRAWANTVTGFLKGELKEVRQVYEPKRRTKRAPEERLAKIAKAIALPDKPVDVSRLWRLLEEVCRPAEPCDELDPPWHEFFRSVPPGAVVVPAVLPHPDASRANDPQPAPSAAWAKKIGELARSMGAKPWVWVIGPTGSGRRHAAAGLVAALGEENVACPILRLDGQPEEGWERYRDRRPDAVVVAVAENRPLLNRRANIGDAELMLGPWGGREVRFCAARLRELGHVDEQAFARMDALGARAEADPEMIGPDRRPSAVLRLVAAVRDGATPATPQDVRTMLRDMAWRTAVERLPEHDVLRDDGHRLLSALWQGRLTNARNGQWWRMSRQEASEALADAARTVWKAAAVRSIDATLAAIRSEKSKYQKGLLIDRAVRLVRLNGDVILDSWVDCGVLRLKGDEVEAADQVQALLLATATLPVALSVAVVSDPVNLAVPREWALQGHPADRVAGLLDKLPLRARPSGWQWLLEFAWQRRQDLHQLWVRRFLAPAWAGLVLAELHGYGDLSVQDPTEARELAAPVAALLRNVSRHWSGVLPDLDPKDPLADLRLRVPQAAQHLLRRWLELRVQLACDGHEPVVGYRWLPWALRDLEYRDFNEYLRADLSNFEQYASATLWQLAPGQLLGLQPGELPEYVRDSWRGRHEERRTCLVARAHKGDVAARAWLSGEHLAFEDGRFCGDSADLKLWVCASIPERLRWLGERARGEQRDTWILNEIASWVTPGETFGWSDHWDALCTVLERQPRQRLSDLVTDIAVPWAPRRLRGPKLGLADGLRLAERFGLVEVLQAAMDIPNRWLALQRAVRVRGQVRVGVLRAADDADFRLVHAFPGGDETWSRLAQAEHLAHLAAGALHRLGRPEALRQRWAALPAWRPSEELTADFAALPLVRFSPMDTAQWDGPEPLPPDVAAEARAWLSRAAAEAEQGTWRFDRSEPSDRSPVSSELKTLSDLVEAPVRFDVAANRLRFCLHFGSRTAGESDDSDAFWATAASPRTHDVAPDARLRLVVPHALWLWAQPPVPVSLAALLDGAARHLPVWREHEPIADWDRIGGLQSVAVDCATRAALALLDLGDDTPLRDWIARLGRPRSESRNWFESGKFDSMAKAVKSQERLGVRAVRLAVLSSSSTDSTGATDAVRVLEALVSPHGTPPPAVPDALLTELQNAPLATVKRFLRTYQPDKRHLLLLRRAHDESATLVERLWFAHRIHHLDPQAELLADALRAWLAHDPTPFAGSGDLRDVQWGDRAVSGFKDCLDATRQLWRAGVLDQDTVRDGVRRLASLVPLQPEVPVEFPLDDHELGDEWLAAHFERRRKERQQAVAAVPGTLLDIAIEIGDRDLAEQVVTVCGATDDRRAAHMRRVLATDEELLASVRAGADLATREDHAMRLARRGIHLEDVRAFATHRLDELVSQNADLHDLAYVLLIFRHVGADDWRLAVDRIQLPLRTRVLAETVASEWAGEHASEALDVIRRRLVDLGT